MISLTLISLYSILLPSGMVFFYWRKLSPTLKIIGGFVLFTLVLEFISYYLSYKGTNNMPLFLFFTLVELIFQLFYFRSFFQNHFVKTTFLILPMVLFISYFFWKINYPETFSDYPSKERMTVCLICIILCLIFFIHLFLSSHIMNLLRYPHYWMVSTFLLYYSGTFFLNLIGQIAVSSEGLSFNAYNIHSVLNIFLNIMFTIVVWMGKEESNSKPF